MKKNGEESGFAAQMYRGMSVEEVNTLNKFMGREVFDLNVCIPEIMNRIIILEDWHQLEHGWTIRMDFEVVVHELRDGRSNQRLDL